MQRRFEACAIITEEDFLRHPCAPYATTSLMMALSLFDWPELSWDRVGVPSHRRDGFHHWLKHERLVSTEGHTLHQGMLPYFKE